MTKTLVPGCLPNNQKTVFEIIKAGGPMTIGILGKKGSGKDTIADYLVREYGFYKTAFAKTLYREVAEAFGIDTSVLNERPTKETPMPALSLDACSDGDFWKVALTVCTKERNENKGSGWLLCNNQFMLSPRKALQLWGTEYRRSQNPYYWLEKVAEEIKNQDSKLIVISDVREPHEAAFVKRRDNGCILKVTRPDNPFSEGSSNHTSETLVDSIAFDREMINGGSVNDLHKQVDMVFGVASLGFFGSYFGV